MDQDSSQGFDIEEQQQKLLGQDSKDQQNSDVDFRRDAQVQAEARQREAQDRAQEETGFDIDEFRREIERGDEELAPEDREAREKARKIDEDDEELSLFTDIPLQAVGAVRDAGNAIKDLPIDIGSAAAQAVTLDESGDKRIQQNAEAFRDFTDLPDIEESNKKTLQAGRAIGQFLVPFAGLSKLNKAKKLTGKKAQAAANTVTATVNGALTDLTAFGAEEKRLSETVKEMGDNNLTNNFVTNWLAGDESDTALEERVKLATEGAGLGFMADSLFRGFKASKRIINGKKTAKKIKARTDKFSQNLKETKNKINELVDKGDIADDLRPNKDEISLGAQREMADQLGITPEKIRTGEAFQGLETSQIRDQVNAATIAQERSFNDLLESSKQHFARIEEGDTQAITDFEQQLRDVLEIDGKVKDAAQDIARTQGFRGNSLEVNTTNEIVDLIQRGSAGDKKKLIKGLADSQNAEEARVLIKNMRNTPIRKQTTLENITGQWFMNSILSSPETLLGDTLSNVVFTTWNKAVEKPAAAGIGGLRRLSHLGDTTDRVRLRESQVFIRKLMDDLNEVPRMINRGFERGRGEGVKGQALGALRETGEAIERNRIDEFSRFGSQSRTNGLFPNENIDRVENPILRNTAKTLNNLATYPSAFMRTKDDVVKGFLYRSGVRERAVRNALNEGLQFGTDEFENRVRQLSEVPADDITKQLDEEAQKSLNIRTKSFEEARKEAFTEPGGKFTKAVEEVVDAIPAGRLFVPFVRTINNLSKRAVERSPARPVLPGPGAKESRRRIAQGGAEADEELARIITGTAFMGGMFQLAANGYITGDGPGDKSTRDALLQQGWQRNSFLVNGEYIDMTRSMGPLANMFLIPANLAEIYKYNDNNVSADIEQDASDLIANGGAAIGRTFMSQSFAQQPARMIEALQRQDGASLSDALDRTAAALAVPNLASFFLEDEQLQETTGLIENIRAKAGMDVRPKRDLFGDPITRKDYVSTFFPVGKTTDLKEIPKWKKKLGEAGAYPATPSKRISVDLGKLSGVEALGSVANIEITTEQREELLRIMNEEKVVDGMTVKERIKKLVEGPQWDKLSTVEEVPGAGKSKKEAIQQIYSDAKSNAELLFAAQNPELVQRAVESETSSLTSPNIPSLQEAIVEQTLSIEGKK